jgi:hypothetical protein
MSLEHSPARQKRSSITTLRSDIPTLRNDPEATIADDLLLGAGPIAFFVYGVDTPESRRNVYRNVFKLPLFKHGNTIAALKSGIRAALTEAQHKASEERQQKKEAQAHAIVKPRRRRARQSEQQVAAE